jgi:hypothetical protein
VGEAAQLGLYRVEMVSDRLEALPKLRWQPGHRYLKGQVHEDQQLASLIVELMGNPAALALLSLQELARETLQPLTSGLHFGIELGIGEGAGGLVRKEPCQLYGLLIEYPTRFIPDAERADHQAVSHERQRQHRTDRGWLEAGSDGGRESDAGIGEDVGRDHGLAALDG